jgi:nucleotide-binding universal stress UspA family protein
VKCELSTLKIKKDNRDVFFNQKRGIKNSLANLKNILVALDGSKASSQALDQAIYLARQSQGTITGVFVIPLFSVNVAKPTSKLGQIFAESGKKILAEAKLRCAKNGVLFYSKILCGNEGFKLVSFAKNKKADLIIIGSRGRSNLKEFFLGSVSHYVAHKSPIPVMVVK